MSVTESGFSEETTSRFVQLGDYRMHYHEAGEGETVILLHGGGPGANAWGNYRSNLAALAKKFRVIAIDMVGYGKSDKPMSTAEDFSTFNARAIVRLLDNLGVEKAHLVGNSYGGSVALVTALDYPLRTGRLVLMGPAGAFSPFAPWPTDGIKSILAVSAPPGPTVEKMQAMIDLLVYDSSVLSKDLVPKRVEAANEPEHFAWLSASHRHNRELFARGEAPRWAALWQELHKIKNQTLLIWGRDDRMVPVDSSFIMLRRLPDARLMVFSQCGHWVQSEKPEEFNRAVLDFLTLPDSGRTAEVVSRQVARATGGIN